jgi:hypothetical protein
VTGLLLAQATSDNTAEGAYFSLWFPLGLFIIVIAALWTLYARPHQRIPARRPTHAHPGRAANQTGTSAQARGRAAWPGTATGGAWQSSATGGAWQGTAAGEPRPEHPGSGYTASGGTGAAGRSPDDDDESGGQSPPDEGKEAGE